MKHWDAIVIGVGAMGSAACYHLARRGARVLGLEQFDVPNDRGSSHGQTRIIRRAYFEHPDYVPLLNRSYELWSELEADTGVRLVERCGLLLAGRPDGEVVAGVRRAATEHQLDIQDVPPSERSLRFNGMTFDSDMDVLFEPDGGFLRPELCIETHVRRAVELGAEIRTRQTVRGWSIEGGGVIVETASQRHSADTLVICGGTWSARLLNELRWPLEIRRKVVVWLSCADPVYAHASGFPVFGLETDDGFFYGFPTLDDGLLKMAEHTGGQTVGDPDALDRTVRETDLTRLRAFAARYLPQAGFEPARSAVCTYTMTPDGHFVIDRHPAHDNVFVAAGFSGHGFKFAPVVGEALAELAMTGANQAPLGFLSAQRFGEERCQDDSSGLQKSS